jgi:hypothetical protein
MDGDNIQVERPTTEAEYQEAMAEAGRVIAGEPLAAEPQAAGEVVIGEEGITKGWTVIRWRADLPPIAVGTKLYTSPPAAPLAAADARHWCDTCQVALSHHSKLQCDGCEQEDVMTHWAARYGPAPQASMQPKTLTDKQIDKHIAADRDYLREQAIGAAPLQAPVGMRYAVQAALETLESLPNTRWAVAWEKARTILRTALASTDAPLAAEPLTDKQITACVVEAGCHGGAMRMCYDSGPYGVTRPTTSAIELTRAIERAHGIGAAQEKHHD